MYGDYVDLQYYNLIQGGAIQGGRIVTPSICTIGYTDQDIISADEKQKNRDKGNNLLLVCRPSFDLNIKIPTSGGSGTIKKNTHRKKGRKGNWNRQWHKDEKGRNQNTNIWDK